MPQYRRKQGGRAPVARKGRTLKQPSTVAYPFGANLGSAFGSPGMPMFTRPIRRSPRIAARAAAAAGARVGTAHVQGQYKKKVIKDRSAPIPRRKLGEIVVRQNMITNVFNYKALDTDFDGNQGYNVLSKVNPSGTGNLITYWPVYAYNLTTIVQGGTGPSPFYRLYSTNINQMKWVQRNGLDAAGLSNNALQLRTVGGVGAGVAQEKSFLDWVRIRATLYGAKNRPMTIRMRLVRFLDESAAPEQTLSTTEQTQGNAFWYAYIKSLVAHPISGGSSPVLNKNLKVLASKTFQFQPSNSTDLDTDPQHKTIDWFRRMALRLSYAGGQQSSTAFSNTSVVNAGIQSQDAGLTHLGTRPSKVQDNVYLLIDCNAYGPTPTVGGADGQAGSPDVTSDDAASFDINIEQGHKSLDTV